jgi:Protein of unknown function (DUF1761)
MLLMCVNLWAVLGSAVATMVIGFLWYSPFLFAKPWMLAMGYDPADKAKIAEMQKSPGPSTPLHSWPACSRRSSWASSFTTWPLPRRCMG